MVSWTKKLKGKKVLINIRQLQQPYTGVQSYIYNLVKSLIVGSSDTQFQLLTLNYNGKNTFIQDLLSHHNTQLVNHCSKSYPFDQVVFDLLIVNRYIPDSDLYFNPVNMTPYFRNKLIPHVVGVLDLCTFIVPHTTTLTLKTYYDLFLKSSLKRADRIVTISDNTRSDLIKLFSLPRKKIEVIHLGIDPDFISSKAASTSNLLKQYKLKSNQYFVTLATSPRKNVHNTMSAFAILRQKYPHAKLFLISSSKPMFRLIGNQQKKLRIPTSSLVISKKFLSVPQLKYLYKQSLGLVFCPWYEGFGLPILEAMNSGAPVITSHNSSLSEIAGSAALFADPDSEIDIYQNMEKLYTDSKLRQQLITKGIKNSKLYSWSSTATQLLKLFLTYFK